MEEIRYIVKVTDDMKFYVFDNLTMSAVKYFDSLVLAKEYAEQLNRKVEL